jgi:hypothetical protein
MTSNDSRLRAGNGGLEVCLACAKRVYRAEAWIRALGVTFHRERFEAEMGTRAREKFAHPRMRGSSRERQTA